MEAAAAILGTQIDWLARALGGTNFTDKRYRNLKTRWMLSLPKQDQQLVIQSTYIDDGLDVFGLIPLVGRSTSRQWYSQVLQVAYAAMRINQLMREWERLREKLDKSLRVATPQAPSSLQLLGGQEGWHQGSWLDYLVTPIMQEYARGFYDRVRSSWDSTEELFVKSEELAFAVMHLQRGLSSTSDAIQDAEALLVFHASKVMEGGLGLFESAHNYVKKKSQASELRTAPHLSFEHLEKITQCRAPEGLIGLARSRFG